MFKNIYAFFAAKTREIIPGIRSLVDEKSRCVHLFFGLRCFLLGRPSLCVQAPKKTWRNGSVYSNFWNVHFLPSGKRLHSFFYWTWPSRNSGFSSSWCKRLPGRVILFTEFSQSLNPDWTEIHPMISRLSYVPGSLVNSLAMTQVPKLEVPTKAYVSEYHHKIWPYIWYSTSILGCWNSHWPISPLEFRWPPGRYIHGFAAARGSAGVTWGRLGIVFRIPWNIWMYYNNLLCIFYSYMSYMYMYIYIYT